ncbi:UNVERIFIED_CONTAM: hypothetical protein Scaly_1155200 [Sesamum calycinum]|uniref:Uncharacterized protein n=1 Tax=Sesamum calycinum TaxID=2727403 RepID=A0AAW2Q2C1_9LAMI
MQFFKAQEYSKVFKAKIESFVKDTIKLALTAGFTLEFEDGVKTFIEWAKGQYRYMDGDKIRIIMRLIVFFKCRRSQPPLAMLRVIIHNGVMNNIWIGRRRMVFYAVGPSYFASYQEGVPNDGTRSVPMDVGTSSYIYEDGGPYDYDESRDGRYKPARGRDPHRKKSPYAVLRYLLLTPRFQSLYSSEATDEHMTWHATHQTVEGSMCYPSDAEAWRHFDQMYPDFAEEPRNVRLGLCIDGFAPHASDRCVLGSIDRIAAAIVACGCENVRPCNGSGFHDASGIDVDCEPPTRLWNGIWVEYRGGYGMSGLYG